MLPFPCLKDNHSNILCSLFLGEASRQEVLWEKLSTSTWSSERWEHDVGHKKRKWRKTSERNIISMPQEWNWIKGMISKLEILRVRQTFSISFKETQGYWSINNSRNVLVGYQFLFAKDCFLSGQEQACSRTNFRFWVFVVTMPKMASYWKMAIDCVCVLGNVSR